LIRLVPMSRPTKLLARHENKPEGNGSTSLAFERVP